MVILAIVIAATAGGGSKTAPPTSTKPNPTATAPSFAVQTFKDDRGITVNVPAGWKKSSTSSYTDFTDPQSSSRRLRINVEPSGTDTPTKFLTVAERGLKNPQRCTAPYDRVALTTITMDGRPAADLEYTCGSGTGKRHGIWAATTESGNAYHFYLTVPDSEFDAEQADLRRDGAHVPAHDSLGLTHRRSGRPSAIGRVHGAFGRRVVLSTVDADPDRR